MAYPIPLTQAELALLTELARAQAEQGGRRPLPMLDLAVKHFGVESEARHVLQRLLVHGLIELDGDAQAKRECLGAVTVSAPFSGTAGGPELLREPGGES